MPEYKTTVFRPGRFLCQCVCEAAKARQSHTSAELTAPGRPPLAAMTKLQLAVPAAAPDARLAKSGGGVQQACREDAAGSPNSVKARDEAAAVDSGSASCADSAVAAINGRAAQHAQQREATGRPARIAPLDEYAVRAFPVPRHGSMGATVAARVARAGEAGGFVLRSTKYREQVRQNSGRLRALPG